jgi:two-component system, OmpR family, alkaline phosphatase synthesis response regulator PhoP
MKKILVIDDEAVIRQVYTEKLMQEGFEAVSASDGETGYQIALAENPDLIILDIIMPGRWSGEDTLKQIKQNDKTKHIPVIMLTNVDNQVFQTYDEGSTWYFIKVQTSLEEVVAKIKSILKMTS